MIGILIFGGIASLAGILLVILYTRLNKEDYIVEKVLNVLPGYNCGACGYLGCKALAREILDNIDNVFKCKPMKDKKIKKKIIDKILE